MASETERPGLRIFGFPLRISPFHFLVVAMLGMPDGQDLGRRELAELAIWIAAVCPSILWHELGHAFAMHRYGYAPRIELYGMGGRTFWGAGPQPTPGQRVFVSLAGPFAGFLLGALVWAITMLVGPEPHWALGHALTLLLWVNVGWGLVNLVPMLPWDGGQALHGLLDHVTGGRGRTATAIVTLVFGALALAYAALMLHSVWLSLLALLSVVTGARALRAPEPALPDAPATVAHVRAALSRVGAQDLATTILRERKGEGWGLAATQLEAALAGDGGIDARAELLELIAWAHLLDGEVDRAERAVASLRETHDPSAALAALLAARRGCWDEALRALRELDDDEAELRVRVEAHALIALRRAEAALELTQRDASERGTFAFVDESLFVAGFYDEAADLGERAFARFGVPDDAYNVACSHARAGRPLEGLRWLERAIDAGYRDLDQLVTDEDLERVRALEGFAELRERLER